MDETSGQRHLLSKSGRFAKFDVEPILDMAIAAPAARQ
jgi:hypothetical protein